MATTIYRMELAYKRVQLEITNFDREPYKRTIEPTPSTFNRFTAIAEKAATEQHPALTFDLLRAENGEIMFGWELTKCDFRNCPTCGRVICDYEKEYATGGDCFMCGVEERAAAVAEARVKEFLESIDQADRDTAPFAPRPQCQVEPDGDILFA